jgi:hypothetical protein
MPSSNQFQSTRGTVLATFTQTGSYSGTAIYLGGGWLVGMYSDNWPSAAGSITFRSSYAPTGTGWPVQTADGTALKVSSFGSGTFYTLGAAPFITAPMEYITLQIGTAGTAGAAAGGTIVLITEA